MNKITLGKLTFTVVDLTQPLLEKTEVYPGDPKPEKNIFSSIKDTGYEHYVWKVGDHNFCPHADAPKHQNSGLQNRGMDFFGPDFYFNPACFIETGTQIVTKEHLLPFSQALAQKRAVVIRTGYDKHLEKNKPHNQAEIPYLNQQAAEFLATFKNLRVIGIDSITIDPCGKHTAHQLLTKDRLVVESLVHLEGLPESFDLLTIPIKIASATGGPVAACALIQD